MTSTGFPSRMPGEYVHFFTASMAASSIPNRPRPLEELDLLDVAVLPDDGPQDHGSAEVGPLGDRRIGRVDFLDGLRIGQTGHALADRASPSRRATRYPPSNLDVGRKRLRLRLRRRLDERLRLLGGRVGQGDLLDDLLFDLLLLRLLLERRYVVRQLRDDDLQRLVLHAPRRRKGREKQRDEQETRDDEGLLGGLAVRLLKEQVDELVLGLVEGRAGFGRLRLGYPVFEGFLRFLVVWRCQDRPRRW